MYTYSVPTLPKISYFSRQIMKHYWEILRRYKVNLLFSPLLVLIGVVSETIQPRFMAEIVDEGVMRGELQVVLSTGVKMVVISLFGLGASIINVLLSTRTSVGFATELRAALFRKIQQFSFAEIDRFHSASLITRLTNDISRLQQVIQMTMRIMLRSPLMLSMAIFFILGINKELALLLLLSVPPLGIAIYIIMRKGFPFFMKVQQKIDALNGVVRENLINIRVVKSFVRERTETDKFTRSSEDLRDTSIRASNTIITIFPVMQLIMNLSVIVILWFGGNMVTSGELRVGELISFVNYLMQVLMSLMMLSMVIMHFARASASSERILEVLNTESTLTDTPRKENGLRIQAGAVAFDRVRFRYAGGENDVLKEISFCINAGERVAIVGGTGSSKSTLVQLIPRLYDTTEGSVTIDGINVRDYALEELHARVGMVLQNNELFSGTILENLLWGKSDATQQEVEEAARAARAHDFITGFPDGYQTLLGRGGVNLSGGQKQRICIARALLRKPRILILDDSTSAVDSDTEQKIRENLNRLLKGTTVFVITQRVHTMQAADRVIVLEDGKLEAIGSPDEVLAGSETYREIYRIQQTAI